jgi:hypothetical protein
MLPPPILRATPNNPAVVYYCKAGITSGKPVRVLHNKHVYECHGVNMRDVECSMHYDNSTGKPKASGARCVMTVTTGLVGLEYPHDTEPFHLEEAAAIALECDLLIFFEEAGEENLYYRDIFQRRYYCKPGGQSLNGHKLLCWP